MGVWLQKTCFLPHIPLFPEYMEQRTALLLGATGLVGKHCLKLLLEEPIYTTIHAIGRRPLILEHPKLKQHIIDFAQLGETVAQIHAQDLFCCLGSTMKQAGSERQFRTVDYEFPLLAAQQGLFHGANQFLLVSGMGANPKSPLFYARIKGEIEQAISALPFQSISILRPSFLLGERQERRMGESLGKVVMKVISPILFGWFRRYRAIEAKIVAAAMIKIAIRQSPDVQIFDSAQIQELGQQ